MAVREQARVQLGHWLVEEILDVLLHSLHIEQRHLGCKHGHSNASMLLDIPCSILNESSEKSWKRQGKV